MSATPDSTFADAQQINADLRRQLAECRAEHDEALAREAAMADVLGVINSSPGDLAPVFDTILEKAHTLCGAAAGGLVIIEGEQYRAIAVHGEPSFAKFWMELGWIRAAPGAFEPLRRGEPLHTPDVTAYDQSRLSPQYNQLVELSGARSLLVVPLCKDNALLGMITAFRQEVRPFTDKQVALLQNFAAQAVIAMENARLITETREALEQQTATAEVLQVINSSPGDLAPVFEVILEKAHRLCGVHRGSLQLFDGDRFRAVATRFPPNAEAFAERLRRGYPASDTPVLQPLRGGVRFVHVPDLAEVDDPVARAAVAAGTRSILYVPLRRDDAFLGMIVAAREEVRPFSEKEIALLENFAAQAVIAMENARLLTETREALEQQTATAEVLQVINSSPGDLAPVFDAILEKARFACGAPHGDLWIRDGDVIQLAATHGDPGFAEWLWQHPRVPLWKGSPPERVVLGEEYVQFDDAREDDSFRLVPEFLEQVERAGLRSTLLVPLRKEDAVLGVIVVYRCEVRRFSDKQIALLQNFAAQAVIAMENARLLTETRAALEQQTATAEVLQVINSSPGDLTPVFDAILDKAQQVCGVDHAALELYDGERMHAVAVHGASERFAETLRQGYPANDSPAARALLEGERFAQIADAAKIDHIAFRTASEVDGIRTVLFVPLRREDVFLGMIASARREVRLFSEKEIALLENFAAQAVIAMENARLITETREALEQQTATAEVLQVINSSPGDLAPVFDAMLERAMRLCDAACGMLVTFDGTRFQTPVHRGLPAPFAEYIAAASAQPGAGGGQARVLRGETVVHHVDMKDEEEYRNGINPNHRAMVDLGGARTNLVVPLRKDATLLGTFTIYRQEVRPFSEKQIALLQNFAAQAVIAMENARLLTETREALEQQTATAEILEVINRSPGNLAPVYEVILEKAHNLCGVGRGTLQLYDGEYLRVVAAHAADVPTAFVDRLRQGYRASDYPLSRPLLDGARFVHIGDLAEIDHPLAQTFVELAGTRSVLFLPLRKEGALLGVIASSRQEVRPFSEKEIALLENFAAQAVIAIDNARLLNEIRQRQAELRVTFDNMGDGVAMFDAELRLAAWNQNFQRILDLPNQLLAERLPYADYIRFLARRGEFGNADIEAELSRRLEGLGQELRFEHTRPDGSVIEVRRNAVPGGGFVVIYSDVTERKRAEAEIRSARDTAERALQELQTAQASLVHAQKMAALGQLTAGIAHEIKNPLNFVNNFAELSGELLLELKETTAPAVAALGDDERAAVDEVVEMLRGNLDKIAEHGKRADGIVKSMLEHSRGVSGERRAVDLNALIEEALNLAYHGARAQDASFNITLEREFDRGIAPAELAPQEMTRVFLNLFGNGFYATTRRQRDGAAPDFRPTLKVATRDLGDAVEVRVRDNGTGIAPEIRDKLFQPFVTTKPTGEGTGLGLSIAWDIVTQQHGGTIEVDSQVGEFTEFTIRLPRAYGATIAEAAA